MTYRLSMAVDDNIQLEIEEPNFIDLLNLFEKMGGDKDWLVNTAKASVAASLHGEAARVITRSLGGNVKEDVQEQGASPAARSATGANGRGSTAGSGQTAPRSDPWASDQEYPGEASVARDTLTSSRPRNDDPWGTEIPEESTEERQQRPSQGRTRPAPAGAGNTEKDKWGNEWTLGLTDAPECDCYETAARVKAKSKAGKWYTVFRCAKGGPGGDWKSKCEFSEFPN